MVLFLSSCIDPLSIDSPCNPKDPDSGCYLASPGLEDSDISITAYNIDELHIYLDELDDTQSAESITYIRYKKIVDVWVKEDSTETSDKYIVQDSNGIEKDATYKYKLNYNNSNGESSAVETQEYEHIFPGPTMVQMTSTSATTFNLSWESQSIFEANSGSTFWKITKIVTIGDSAPYDETYPIEELDYSEDGSYELENNISVHEAEGNEGELITYEITIKEIKNGIDSDDSESSSLSFNVLNFEFIEWIPLSSNKMLVYWKVVESTIGAGYDLYIENNDLGPYSVHSSTVDADNLLGYFIDVMPPDLVSAGQPIEYKFIWCDAGDDEDLSECPDMYVKTATFPIYDMEYIPKVAGTIENPFYIDIYEVYQSLYIDDDYNDGLILADDKSPVSVNYNNAAVFCGGRTAGINTSYQIDTDFRIPTEFEWNIAASFKNSDDYGYEFIETVENDSSFAILFNSIIEYDYPVEVGLYGVIDCSYANTINCSDENSPFDVGNFDGTNFGYNKATSPNNLFDCAGNMMEWVNREDVDNDDREMLMGGDYNSSISESTSDSYMLQYGDYISQGTGFRTALDATEFLYHWRNLND